MKDDKNRVTVALWNMIKPYMMMEVSGEYTPTFGEVVDRFRTMWNVYISVSPATNDDILIYKYRYEVFRLAGNDIKDEFTGSDHAYYLAMRKAIQKAYEFVSALEPNPKM
jgi:hypothetical protein